MLDTTLERTEQPPVEQRCDFMDARHDSVGLFGAGAGAGRGSTGSGLESNPRRI